MSENEYEVTFTIVVRAKTKQKAAQEARDYLEQTAGDLPAKVRLRDADADSNYWTRAQDRSGA